MTGLGALGATLDGELLTPSAPGYDAARRPAFRRYQHVRPQAVVRCASTADVARTLAYAGERGIPAVPRGGGHCFAGRSSTTGLLLDLTPLDAVTVDAGGRATIGAGARLARVYDVLHEHGRTVPAGCGPTVGLAGLTLGGGLGLLGRRYGLTCDALVGARVVLAGGRQVDCAADREPDLFWALRGAGGGQFGVVTSLVLATVPDPRATRVEMEWPATAAAAVVAAWQAWAPDAPDDVTADLAVTADPGRPVRVVAFGAALGDTGAALTDPARPASGPFGALVAASGTRPQVRVRGGLSVRDLKRSFAGPGEQAGGRADAQTGTTSRSEFFARTLPDAAITALLDALATGPAGGRRELAFTALGGAYARVAADATAFAHRGERFLLQHAGGDDDAGWVDRSWRIAHPHGSGRVYPNFPDPRLDGGMAAYHGGNLARLAAVKRAYDPDRFFAFPQSL